MKTVPKILYVDDEKDLLHLAKSFFEDECIPIETCGSFEEALTKVRNGTYDLIISDEKMPSGTGKELHNIILSEKLDCGKFILVTGNLDHTKSDKDKYDLIIFKPLGFQDLVEHAKRILKIKL